MGDDQRLPMSSEEIESAHVGEAPLLNAQVVLMPYSDGWPVAYSVEAGRIGGALEGVRHVVEHVGSTSVPGLAAKPILDVLLIVPDSADESSYVPALKREGYELTIREPDWFEHRVLKKYGEAMPVTLHVLSEGCPEIRRMLAFRDRLRVNEEDRALYERTKLALAGQQWKYLQNYADAKTEVVEAILSRAL
ncbi:GrpB family protein [Sinosporangium siamense]|uniref:GrpB family protein n=1 Tax=Sinosporangium siamense TaxID=1367973 RepID=A0A919RN13_9ACTN|nr:GrpB family protein [Sinosporangium siamense]GII95004.1 hypothetical protein Ssi02_52350 [Sinosporangium siamense]